jgi:hypothetical protein
MTRATSLRATGRAASIALAIAVATQPGCGIAERAGRGATEGALQTLAGKVPDRDRIKHLTEGIKRRVVTGALDELGQPEQLEDLQRIAAAMASGTVSGALRASGTLPVEAVTEQAARAFSRQMLAELGPTGDGPLATSVSATMEQVSASMARGVRGELAPLFPECSGADASGCLDRAVERVSRASSAGVAAGIRESLGGWPLALAFGAGALAALALAWAWEVYRGRGRRSGESRARLGNGRTRRLRERVIQGHEQPRRRVPCLHRSPCRGAICRSYSTRSSPRSARSCG